MIYPPEFEDKLGFSKIREKLKQYCLKDTAKQIVDKEVCFSGNRMQILKKGEETNEFSQIIQFAEGFPGLDYYDLLPVFKHIAIEGSYILTQQLLELRISLENIKELKGFFDSTERDDFPRLKKIVNEIEFDKDILKEIYRIIDEKARIKDNASSRLKEIRTELHQSEKQKAKQERQLLKDLISKGIVDKNTQFTIRNDRAVVPVLAHNKKQVQGFTHDVSSTGQTAYIEPTVLFELNNKIKSLENEEEREIIKILSSFTDFLRPHIEWLRDNISLLALLDLIAAKAKYAIGCNAQLIRIEDKRYISWTKARHPLLEAHLAEQGKKIVPNDIEINDDERIIIISGPNAGGKSVCLQSVALLQYMLQCGLLIPVDSSSSSGVFSSIFLDMGDDQSIEDDLSTYSSHLINMRKFTEEANDNSLFLIDEFGTGTEPQIGGAIAESILEELYKKGAFGIITTHYANLKLMADRFDGIKNAAMLFDQKKMEALFMLQKGKPGSSFAFEIASKTGLGKEIIDNAKEKTGVSQLDFEQQLNQLEGEKRELEEKLESVSKTEDALNEMVAEYKEKNALLEEKRKAVLYAAKQQAKKILDDANKRIENAVFEIKKTEADKENTKKLRKDIEERRELLQESIDRQVQKTAESRPKEQFSIGQLVRVVSKDAVGEIVELRNKQALIGFGDVKILFPFSDLLVEKKDNRQKVQYEKYGKILDDINTKKALFKREIDVRGKRVEEVITEVEKYIDDAILLSVKNVRILHGKGTGALRIAIRETLQATPEVKRYKDEHVDFGGYGITVVEIE
jgi:DNA mismatch repair protein MutS2